MHIFIDESGTFALSDQSSISAVGSLVVPSYRMADFERLYARLRKTLPKHKGEVKGRLLDEGQVTQVAGLVRRMEGIFDVVLVDMAMHSRDALEVHRANQAVAITAHLTEAHHPNLVAQVWKLRRELEGMSLQLYVQAIAMQTLVYHTLNHANTYLAFRQPKELAAYHWTIDAKHDGDHRVPWEEWWRDVVMPMLESHTMREPFMMVEGGDYSGHARFETTPSEWKMQFVRGGTGDSFLSIREVLREDFRFSSASEPGLEVVDILVNAMRRSLAGNFSRYGWLAIPSLMINRRPQSYHLVALGPGPERAEADSLPYSHVLRDFKNGGRTMLPPRFLSEMS